MKNVLVLLESDDHVHGVLQIPHGKTQDSARADADNARARAIAANPEQWNYSDVIANLKALGYERLSIVESWE